ncbi:MAG TPA: 1,4-dihydroxy-2-naphthoate polyprenyltransferase [Prolixibacteraceae bacterium]|nr:1,4-dihydroxy-2-naphthoate polyprenyltransferase [Prolixibacteraceae bacterium]
MLKTDKIQIWLKAFRLRTLPLALANAVMGSFLALFDGDFRWSICILIILTITSLQILSNLANDYGDAVSGADGPDRIGPTRVTSSGLVTRKEMKEMITVFVLFSIVSGTLLILLGLRHVPWIRILIYFGLGLAAIVAAIKYTVGKKPYGYRGFGDLFVFIFFGLVGVIGSYYLYTNWLDKHVIIPAISIGLLSTAVLNINNLRDIPADTESGKITLPVKFGFDFARKYHLALVGSALILAIFYSILHYFSPWQFLFVLTLPLFYQNAKKIYHYDASVNLNKELGNLSLATLLFAFTFGLGLILFR